MEEKSEKVIQPEKTEVSRRELLRRGITLGVSLTAFCARLSYEGSNIFSLRKERHLTKTPEGCKIGMILGAHGEPGSPSSEITPIKEKDLFFPVGALFLDECVDYRDSKIQRILPVVIANETHPFLKEPLKYALENNLPVILGDITLRGISPEDFFKAGKRSLFLTSISFALAGTGVTWETVF